ncbi:MAG: 1,4-dihydroxy-2-naphthoate octaprenyltransferase [Lentimicrobiaceae bacterium]|nr:1,4-dihydroxy-2-naphthoate octaprenyltransferase [Lentimicrobiaceae bacterium]
MHKFYYSIKALRLISLPLSLSGIIMGGLLANSFGYFSWLLFGLALITAAALHLTCNLANDIGDYQSGNDSVASVGYETMLLSGKLSVKEVKVMVGILTAIAVTAGIALVYFAFGNLLSLRALVMLSIGAVAVCAAILYTIGKKPYGYRAFGDLAVFLFFGIAAVAGTFFLLTQTLPAVIFFPAVSMGFLVTGVVNINNIRDMENDIKYRKTIPILIGEKRAKLYQTALVFLPFLLMMIYDIIIGYKNSIFLLGHLSFLLLMLPVAIYHISLVYKHKGLELNKPLGYLIVMVVLFSLIIW